MKEPITPTRLRKNLYSVLDEVLESGEPVVIERKGRKLRIVAEPEPNRLANVKPMRGLIVGDPEELADLDWSSQWRPDPS